MPPAAGSFPAGPRSSRPRGPASSSLRGRAAARSGWGSAAPLPGPCADPAALPPLPARPRPPAALPPFRKCVVFSAPPLPAGSRRAPSRPPAAPPARLLAPHAPYSPPSPWRRWSVPGTGSCRCRIRGERKSAAPGRAGATGGEASGELGLPRGGTLGGRPAVGPMPPPPPGLLPLLLPRVCSSRHCSAPRTPPQLRPAPPPHFLKYANCVQAPPTPATSPLPEQPDTRRRARPRPSRAPPPGPGRAGCSQSGLPAGGRRARGARAHDPGGPAAPRPGRARWLARGGSAALLPPPCLTGLLCRAPKIRSGCGSIVRTRVTGTETPRGEAFPVPAGSSSGTKGSAEVGSGWGGGSGVAEPAPARGTPPPCRALPRAHLQMASLALCALPKASSGPGIPLIHLPLRQEARV